MSWISLLVLVLRSRRLIVVLVNPQKTSSSKSGDDSLAEAYQEDLSRRQAGKQGQ